MQVNKKRFGRLRFDYLLLLVFVAVSLGIRAWLPYDHVFMQDGTVRFAGVDAWYHVRLMDYLLYNYPRSLLFDGFAIYPGGQQVPTAPFFDTLVVSLALLFNAGEPSLALVETIAAFAPPVMGALLVIPVYFIARIVWGRTMALLAAGLMAVQAGPFASRTILGFSDHHAAEVLFSTLIVLAFVMVLNIFDDSPTNSRQLRDQLQQAKNKRFYWLLLFAVASMSAYLMSWGSAALLVAMLGLYLLLLGIVDIRNGTQRPMLWLFVFLSSLLCLPVVILFHEYLPNPALHWLSLLALACQPLLFYGNRWCVARLSYPMAGLALLLTLQFTVLVLALAWLHPLGFEALALALRRLSGVAGNTVAEVNPMLMVSGKWSLWPVVEGYGWVFFLALLGLVFLFKSLKQEFTAAKLLILVWCLGMLLVSLLQNRFGYYLAVNIALLSALVCTWVFSLAGISGHKSIGNEKKTGIETTKANKTGGASVSVSTLYRGLAVFVVLGMAYFPSIYSSVYVARADFGPPAYWLDTLDWMRQNTLEPETASMSYSKPAFAGSNNAYGVLSWWDYGYWILRVAQRIPMANPTQNGAVFAARFFTETDPGIARKMLGEAGGRYVLIDAVMSMQPQGASYFPAIVSWAGREALNYVEVYRYHDSNGVLQGIMGYKPAYYQSMVARLFHFNARQISQVRAWLFRYEIRTDAQGGSYKYLTGKYSFNSYEDALRYQQQHPQQAFDLVGLRPDQSCVPLQAITEYVEQYRSGLQVTDDKGISRKEVMLKLFSLEP